MEFTHFDAAGRARMVDVTGKNDTRREAVAEGRVRMSPATLALIKAGATGKGDVLGVARLAGVMGAKQTWQFIPMCHPLLLTGVKVDFALDEEQSAIDIVAAVRTVGRTGVEMEALTAVTVAALAIYDMAKAAEKGMVIEYIRLAAKSGGKSGDYVRQDADGEGAR